MRAFLGSVIVLAAITIAAWAVLGVVEMSSQDVYQSRDNVRL